MGGTNDDEEARQRDMERIKAEARAYALSDMTRKKERERAKFSNLPASMVGGTGRARRRPPPPPQYQHNGAPFHEAPHHHHADQHKPYPPHQQQQPYPAPYGYPYQHHYPYPPYHPQYPPVDAHHQHHLQHQSVDKTADVSPPILSPDEEDPSTRQTSQNGFPASQHPAPSKPTFTPHSWNFDEYDEDYGRFVKSLWDDALFANDEEEDTDEFHLEKEDDEEDENDDDKDEENVDANETSQENSSQPESLEKQMKVISNGTSPLDPNLFRLGEKYYQELEEELGWLEEEDMEAAVTTLLDPPKTPLTSNTTNAGNGKSDNNWSSPAPSISTQKNSPRSQSTPFREAARATHVTDTQYKRLQQLFHSHYQLLLQQTVLAARAAPTQSKTMESASDLMQIVNHATGMLQDIDQHRRNAILSKVQQGAPQRLTRLQFSKTLQEDQSLETVFDVEGLKQLKETFDWIDKSVEVLKAKTQGSSSAILNPDETTIDTDKIENESTMKDKSDDSIDRILPTDTVRSLSFCKLWSDLLLIFPTGFGSMSKGVQACRGQLQFRNFTCGARSVGAFCRCGRSSRSRLRCSLYPRTERDTEKKSKPVHFWGRQPCPTGRKLVRRKTMDSIGRSLASRSVCQHNITALCQIMRHAIQSERGIN